MADRTIDNTPIRWREKRKRNHTKRLQLSRLSRLCVCVWTGTLNGCLLQEVGGEEKGRGEKRREGKGEAVGRVYGLKLSVQNFNPVA